jgi:hypothetical protein
LGTIPAFAYNTGKPRKTCVEVPGRIAKNKYDEF